MTSANKKEAANDEADEETERQRKLLEAKAKFEQQTGKKYKVKEKLPSVQELLLQDALREKPFLEAIKFPALILILFILSLQLFVTYMPPAERKYVLPQMKHRTRYHVHQPVQRHTSSDPVMQHSSEVKHQREEKILLKDTVTEEF